MSLAVDVQGAKGCQVVPLVRRRIEEDGVVSES